MAGKKPVAPDITNDTRAKSDSEKETDEEREERRKREILAFLASEDSDEDEEENEEQDGEEEHEDERAAQTGSEQDLLNKGRAATAGGALAVTMPDPGHKAKPGAVSVTGLPPSAAIPPAIAAIPPAIAPGAPASGQVSDEPSAFQSEVRASPETPPSFYGGAHAAEQAAMESGKKLHPILMASLVAIILFVGNQVGNFISASAPDTDDDVSAFVVQLTSDPSGADVYQLGKERRHLGSTPVVRTFKNTESVTLEFSRPCYETCKMKVSLVGTPVVHARLSPRPASVGITCVPNDAVIYIDGRQARARCSVKPGRHVLKIARQGFETQIREFNAGIDGSLKFDIELKKIEVVFKKGKSTVNSLGMKMRWICAGSFVMGSPGSEARRMKCEAPRHKVTFKSGFWMSATEVTQKQWKTLMSVNPSGFKGEDLPVENVSWKDCRKFCHLLSLREGRKYRLPTEAEWEYSCRAGTRTPFSFGKTINSLQVNFNGTQPYRKTDRVGVFRKKTSSAGMFPPNSFGLYDMHGNVSEWCQDVWKDDYKGAAANGAAWLSGKMSVRVVRGGSWKSSAGWCRSATRTCAGIDTRKPTIGFRVVIPL